MDLSYIINQLGEEREHYFNAVSPPIIQTSNFAFNNADDLRSALSDEFANTLYTRGNNPTIDMLRKKLAALDGSEDALVFSSGVAAIFVAVVANVQMGDHIISIAKPYSWTHKLFNDFLPRFGITCTMIDGTRVENFEKAIQSNTKIIFLESPNTMTFELQDLEAVSKLAKQKNILTIIDNSYCSPLYQQPCKMGIDISVQTATKYLGGHSDTVAGVISGTKEMIKKIFVADFLNIGAVISPFSAWLLLRSLRTFELRVEKSSASAQKVVSHFENHPKVAKMYYPFSKSFPQNDLAKKQMKKPGGMFTVALKTNSVEQIENFCHSLKRFLMAVSWGGHESLVFPACAAIKKEEYDSKNTEHNLVRFYIGLEDPDVLIEDIENALKKI
ncbi:MAG: aminotransferase class I/II-fold pyridoxal phosphate-dependent enzyme [Bacteroidia bacterium]